MIDHFGTPERARPEHEAGVPAQQRALPVHEVGHAGLRHLRRRAAGLRHRPPGQPRVPGARRARRRKGGVYYPDTLVGTDSHTTMINGIGVVGWGVGGIEAEAGMLGQPVYFLTPDVVGVNLTGALREGCTATDLVLHRHRAAAQGKGRRQVRRVLRRRHRVAVDCPTAPPSPTWRRNTARPWASSRSTTRRSTTSAAPAAPKSEIDAFETYFQAQGLFGIPKRRRDRLHAGRRARPRHRRAVPGRPEASAGPYRARQREEQFADCSASRPPRTASTSRRAARAFHVGSGDGDATRSRARPVRLARRASRRWPATAELDDRHDAERRSASAIDDATATC